MKKLTQVFVIIFITYSVSLYAQQYHTPAEILLLLSNSDIKYDFRLIESDMFPEDESEPELILHGYYVTTNENGQKILSNYKDDYESDSKALLYLVKAENYFSEEEFENARHYYEKIYEKMPQNSQIMTFIGQSYGLEEKHDEAAKWYKKAIEANNLDYMAHWFLADVYLINGDFDKALDEILIAHVLNRNNPRINISMELIFKVNGIRYLDWKFEPRYIMSKEKNGEITMNCDKDSPDWLMYMLCKALWAYEPGYKESMIKDSRELPRIIEEKECLAAMAIGHKNKYGDEPSEIEALNVFLEATDKDKVNEFVLYEIVLVEKPLTTSLVNKKVLKRLADYVLKFRTEKITK